MRALLSVYDKSGLVDLAKSLAELNVDLIASGGTSAALESAGIPHQKVEDVTGAPEMLDGRVKTLHPKIHGGVLADRSKPSHLADLESQGIDAIDIVVCNLYPFTSQPSIEMIDVGGPTMVRAAAKNHDHVAVVVNPDDYANVVEELRAGNSVTPATRKRLARAAFDHTAAYDAAIVSWLDGESEELPQSINLHLEKAADLRYGENPHQTGARYSVAGEQGWWDTVTQHSGMALSFLNLFDADAAWKLAFELGDQPTAVIVKHANPCGVAVADDIATAYDRAFDCDPISAFGGIIALNRPVDLALAQEMAANPKADVLIATGYDKEAVELFAAKRKNMRVLEAQSPGKRGMELRRIDGGFLVQRADEVSSSENWKTVTETAPTDAQMSDMEMAWQVCAAVGSNAIVLVNNGQAVGIGAGQQNRLDSAAIAVRKAGDKAKGSVCASDAFFPFRDGLDACAEAGVAAVVQPGGSMRDEEVIAAANENDLAMVLTGERHFRH